MLLIYVIIGTNRAISEFFGKILSFYFIKNINLTYRFQFGTENNLFTRYKIREVDRTWFQTSGGQEIGSIEFGPTQ